MPAQYAIAYRAFGANKGGHVFNDSKHFNSSLPAEVDFLTYIEQSNLLGGCYYHCTSQISFFEVLHCREMFIGRSGRCVEQQEVQLAPVYLAQKLSY